MKKLSNTEAELKKSVTYKKKRCLANEDLLKGFSKSFFAGYVFQVVSEKTQCSENNACNLRDIFLGK